MRRFNNVERIMTSDEVYWLTRYIGFLQGEYRLFRYPYDFTFVKHGRIIRFGPPMTHQEIMMKYGPRPR